jgi:hypothetical protein
MNARTEDELDSIFISFHEDRMSASPKPLDAWVTEHPDLSKCFVQWATEIPSLALADLQPASEAFEAHSLAIGQNILARMGIGAESSPILFSLNDTARNCGKKPRELAQALGIGMSVFAKLNRRLIHAASIPEKLMQQLSVELSVTVNEIRAYLSQSPTLALGADYRSEAAPEPVAPQNFVDAVRSSSDMSEEQKQAWL